MVFNMAEPVLEISENGKNVFTCEDYEKVFSSKLKTLKTYNTYLLEPGDSSSHNLNYQPIFMYCSYLTDKPLIVGLVGQRGLDFAAEVEVDENSVFSYTTSGFSALSLIYVFIEELI